MAAANGFVTVSPDTDWNPAVAGSNSAQEHEAEKFTAPGTTLIEISEIGAWVNCNNANTDYRLSIWTHDAANNCPDAMVANSETDDIAVSTDSPRAKKYFTYSTKPQLITGQIYWLCMKSDTGQLYHSRTSGGGNSMYYAEASAYPEWPTAADWHNHTDQGNQDSLYAVYSEVEAIVPIMMNFYQRLRS